MNEILWKKAVKSHGHECPGLAIGFKACEAAQEMMALEFSNAPDIVCVAEAKGCPLEAVQFLTGCNFANGKLRFKDSEHTAFTFFNRMTGSSLRLILKPLPESLNRQQRQDYLLGTPYEELFEFAQPDFRLA